MRTSGGQSAPVGGKSPCREGEAGGYLACPNTTKGSKAAVQSEQGGGEGGEEGRSEGPCVR